MAWEERRQQQLMKFFVGGVNGRTIPGGASFIVRFAQDAPAWIHGVEGASVAHVPTFDDVPPTEAGPDDELRDEIARLAVLKQQVADLEQLIVLKEQYLLDSFGWSDAETDECYNLKCVVKSLFTNIVNAARPSTAV